MNYWQQSPGRRVSRRPPRKLISSSLRCTFWLAKRYWCYMQLGTQYISSLNSRYCFRGTISDRMAYDRYVCMCVHIHAHLMYSPNWTSLIFLLSIWWFASQMRKGEWTNGNFSIINSTQSWHWNVNLYMYIYILYDKIYIRILLLEIY